MIEVAERLRVANNDQGGKHSWGTYLVMVVTQTIIFKTLLSDLRDFKTYISYDNFISKFEMNPKVI